MKDHNFVYNYSFLSDWFRANPTIKRYDVLANMGMSDYRTLQNWMEGVTIMPVHQIMKFCNLYNVPIHAFFYDEYADEHSLYAKLHPNAMIEPSGGYPEASRTGLKLSDPRTNTHTTSVMPDYCHTSISQEPQDHSTTEQGTAIPQDERMRYLDIIEKLNDRVMELSRENARLQISINKISVSRSYNEHSTFSRIAETEYEKTAHSHEQAALKKH